MSINENGWSRVEQIARQHELNEADHFLPVAPVPLPTRAQQLAFATQRCAELQARLYRIQGKALEIHMWLGMGETARASQCVNQIMVDV